MFKTWRRHHRWAVLCTIIVALISSSAQLSFAQTRRTARRTAARPLYAVATNTVVRVRMNEKLSSKDARVGDSFTTRVVDPVYARGNEAIPAGSTITGRVMSVKRAGRKSEAGSIQVSFTSLRTPQGNVYPINGSLSDLGEENVNADNEGGVSGRSSKKRNIAFIGGGALVGALVNGAAGAAIGGGLGVAGALFSKGKEAEVKPGDEFGVVLNRSLSLAAR
jgi:hypothetical protein